MQCATFQGHEAKSTTETTFAKFESDGEERWFDRASMTFRKNGIKIFVTDEYV